MEERAIIESITETFPAVDVVTATDGLPSGDTFFSYDSDREAYDQAVKRHPSRVRARCGFLYPVRVS